MHQLLSTGLTHREIRSLIGDKMTIKSISLIRRGYRPAQELDTLLEQVDEAKINLALREAKLFDSVSTMITLAEHLLSLDVYTGDKVNEEYLDMYKRYIDLKVVYNKVIGVDAGREPKNHPILIRLHQRIRTQHASLSRMQ